MNTGAIPEDMLCLQNGEALKDEQIKELKQKIVDLILDHESLPEALKSDPLNLKTSDA